MVSIKHNNCFLWLLKLLLYIYALLLRKQCYKAASCVVFTLKKNCTLRHVARKSCHIRNRWQHRKNSRYWSFGHYLKNSQRKRNRHEHKQGQSSCRAYACLWRRLGLQAGTYAVEMRCCVTPDDSRVPVRGRCACEPLLFDDVCLTVDELLTVPKITNKKFRKECFSQRWKTWHDMSKVNFIKKSVWPTVTSTQIYWPMSDWHFQ